MRLLVGHIATSACWERFQMAQRWQSIIGQSAGATHVVVSETHANSYADWETIVEPRGERNGLFNLSAMRNQIRHRAQQGSFDAFMLVESDFVVLRWPRFLPQYWAIPLAIYDNPDSMALSDIQDGHINLFRDKRGWEVLGPRPLIPVHCVIVSRAAFGKAVWDERFEGVGYDDWDFNNQMHGAFGPFSHTDALMLHRWHSTTGATPRPENQSLYAAKWGSPNPRNVI